MNPNPFRAELETLQRRIDSLAGQTPHDRAMQSAFPFGTGRPGNDSSRRTSRQSDRRIETTINRAVQANALIAKRNRLQVQADAYDAGRIDAQGHDTAEVVAEQHAKQEAARKANGTIADYMRATAKTGGIVYLAGQPLIVQRVNPKSITTISGCKWSYDELTPKHPSEPRPMTPREMVAIIRGDGV